MCGGRGQPVSVKHTALRERTKYMFSVGKQVPEKGNGAELFISSFSFQAHNQIKSYHLPRKNEGTEREGEGVMLVEVSQYVKKHQVQRRVFSSPPLTLILKSLVCNSSYNDNNFFKNQCN